MVLVSEEHNRKLVWEGPDLSVNDQVSSVIVDDSEESNRPRAPAAPKTNEQERNVRIQEGFTVCHIDRNSYSVCLHRLLDQEFIRL